MDRLTLPNVIHKKSFAFYKIAESEKGYIFLQVTDCELAFEVFERKISEEKILGGYRIPRKVKYPSDSAFGYWAWSYGLYGDKVMAWSHAWGKFCLISETVWPRIDYFSSEVLRIQIDLKSLKSCYTRRAS